MEPVIESSYTSTIVTATDATKAVKATVATDGLSFNHDDACIYFGSSKNFRIKFIDGSPATLVIQAYSSALSDYVTKLEFSDS
jgi:hypothetical protein